MMIIVLKKKIKIFFWRKREVTIFFKLNLFCLNCLNVTAGESPILVLFVLNYRYQLMLLLLAL